MSYTRKTRTQKADEYQKKYSHIPVDYAQRLEYLYDTLKITPKDAGEILYRKRWMISQMYFTDVNVILFELPEGSPRPRTRLINRKNLSSMAMANSSFIHVYSPAGHEDQVFMKRLVSEQDFFGLDQIICTPCNVDINAYLRTPSYYSRQDQILCEIGAIRPLTKPDWDNIEKKYSDMFNKNVWLDDSLVIDGAIHRYYSVLPRIEIRLRFMNTLYTRQQFNSISNRADFPADANLSYIQV